MAKAHLTDKLLRGVRADGERRDLWDEVVPGLVARVSQAGAIRFVLSYRMGGRDASKRRLTLGDFPDCSLAEARDRARVAKGQIVQGLDPVAIHSEEPKADKSDSTFEGSASMVPTFGQLADDYLRLHPKVGTRWWKEIERVLDRELRPAWNSVPVNEIRRRAIVPLLQAIAARPAPVQANRTRAILSAIFTFAVEQDVVDVNPVTSTKKPAREVTRERVLSEEELAQAWVAFGDLVPSLGLHLRFKMFTLQRGGEIRTMTRRHVSGNWWTIPRELTKTKRREHRVPLSPSALEILEQATVACRGPELYFPSPRNAARPVDYGAPAHACRRIYQRRNLSPFTPHDIRRSAATYLAQLRVDELLIARILSHSTTASERAAPAVTGIYNRHAYDEEKFEALLLWERKLLSILSAL